jgi:hypothetical protein
VACAVLASSALAAEYPISALPQLGRCVKGPDHSSEWKYKHCQDHVPGHGEYEWLEGPGAKPKFEAEGVDEARLETANSKHLIACGAWIQTGEYVSAKSEKTTIDLVGCELSGTTQRCETSPVPEKEGEIEFEADGELGFIKGGGTARPTAGWDLREIKTTITCGAPPETNILIDKLEGSVIAPVKKTANMLTEEHLYYKEIGGKQVPEMFEGGTKDTLSSEFREGLTTTTTEQTGLLEKEVVVENEEPLEIKVRCVEGPSANGPNCT